MEIDNRECKSCVKYESCKTEVSLRKCQRTLEELYYSGIKDMDILEIGCGNSKKGGFIKNIVEKNNCRWSGIDIIESDITTHVCGVEKMPFEDESFDWVLGSQTLEHWNKPKKALKEVKRVLRPNGKVSLTAPIHLHGEKMFVRGDFQAIFNLIQKSGFNIEKFETWRKNYDDLEPAAPTDYAKKKLKKAGITDATGMTNYIIHCIISKADTENTNGFWKNLFKEKPIVDMLQDRLGCEKGKTMLVVGAGGTLRENADAIKKFIQKENAVTIGINKMTEFCTPDYHLWTNKQRWNDFGDCISNSSTLLFGTGLSEKLIRKHYNGDYIRVDYSHSLKQAEAENKVDYKDGRIYGNFRTAGCLAIMIAHLFKAENIYIVGMDGFTLHGRNDVEKGSQNQHCYGKGYTDDATWEECVKKDEIVYDNLNALDEYGVKFKIITPTKFQKFHDPQILQIDDSDL